MVRHILVHMISHQTRITTNIDSRLLRFVDRTARERLVSRRKVIEESLLKLEREAKKQAIIEAYNRMADDKELMDEWLAIANNPANLKF